MYSTVLYNNINLLRFILFQYIHLWEATLNKKFLKGPPSQRRTIYYNFNSSKNKGLNPRRVCVSWSCRHFKGSLGIIETIDSITNLSRRFCVYVYITGCLLIFQPSRVKRCTCHCLSVKHNITLTIFSLPLAQLQFS